LSRLRLLIVLPDLHVGGTQQYVVRTLPGLRRRGIDVEVCALDGRGPLTDIAAAAGIRIHSTAFPRWRRRRDTTVLPLVVREVAQILRAGRFDAVHSYLYWPDVVSSLAGRVARRRRIVVSRRALHAGRHPPSVLLHWLESISNSCATELIANSNAVLYDAERNETLLPTRRGVVYNGIDVFEYTPRSWSRTGALRMLAVGSLAPLKGQVIALQALKLVHDAGVEATLDLVGSGPDESMLRATAQTLGITDSVNFRGACMDPRATLSRADLFLLPSRQEGFSNALLEAMASALPAVVTDVGGNSEALVDGEGGRVVPPEDAAAMAQAIVDLARSPDALAQFGRFNRALVEARFRIETSVDRLVDWYRESG